MTTVPPARASRAPRSAHAPATSRTRARGAMRRLRMGGEGERGGVRGKNYRSRSAAPGPRRVGVAAPRVAGARAERAVERERLGERLLARAHGGEERFRHLADA